MEYRVKTYSSETVFSLMERFGLDSLTSTILAQRGYDWKKMAYFFEEDMIFQHSPFLFQDSFDAVERISDALDENEKIMVYGDRDCDGITSSAIVIRELRRLGAKDNLVYRLPLDDEPYGLTMEIVKEVIDKDVKLLITVDNGITAVEEIRALRKNGVDVIVLDHHLSGEDFPGLNESCWKFSRMETRRKSEEQFAVSFARHAASPVKSTAATRHIMLRKFLIICRFFEKRRKYTKKPRAEQIYLYALGTGSIRGCRPN